MENNHPFFGAIFTSLWSKHFQKQSIFEFKFIDKVKFVRNKYLPIYYNVGRNITNGMYYNLDQSQLDYKGKTFLVYDVLSDIMSQKSVEMPAGLSIKRIGQYKGYLSSLESFEDFEDYFANQFSSKSRTNLRKYLKRLDTNFGTRFKVFHGTISKEEYDVCFRAMSNLIAKRFGELELENNILKLKDYYYELCYQMILNKEASFNILYVNDKPSAISFCFLSSGRAYFAITTFDTDFRRYNLGHIIIMKIMEWCFENNIKEFDYSKGTYDYKTRWANKSYYFENHILYDNDSLKSTLIANLLSAFFKFKQYLRDVNFNRFYSKLKYYVKKKPLEKIETSFVEDIKESELDLSKCTPISLEEIDGHELKPVVYDILFSKPQNIKNIELFKNNEDDCYLIRGKSLLQKISFG